MCSLWPPRCRGVRHDDNDVPLCSPPLRDALAVTPYTFFTPTTRGTLEAAPSRHGNAHGVAHGVVGARTRLLRGTKQKKVLYCASLSSPRGPTDGRRTKGAFFARARFQDHTVHTHLCTSVGVSMVGSGWTGGLRQPETSSSCSPAGHDEQASWEGKGGQASLPRPPSGGAPPKLTEAPSIWSQLPAESCCPPRLSRLSHTSNTHTFSTHVIGYATTEKERESSGIE